MKRPVALVILDGFGIGSKIAGNAVKAAKLPNFERLSSLYPTTRLQASGLAVGLPEGQMGNSEVGHLNIGAGRIVYQELTRITKAITDGDFYENAALLEVMQHTKASGTKLHLMGLLSDGGVHSHLTHLYALLRLAKKMELEEVLIHCFLDGRDTPPQSAVKYLKELQEQLREIGIGKIATITGRYYAMDRDKRWERTKLAYDAIVLGRGTYGPDPIQAVEDSYARGENDEFVKPILCYESSADTLGPEDGVIFFNFRPDRGRQLSWAFTDPNFDGFEREKGFFPLDYVTMTLYDAGLVHAKVAYAPQSLKRTLGEYVSEQGLQQLRIAETEKYAHVTYFFNGGVEVSNPGEDRVLIPSPKVATYDLQPEMSAPELTDTLLAALDQDKYDLVIVNYANPDMVGHTGIFDAVVKALETVDTCLGKVTDKILEKGGAVLVTSDHGNSEELLNEETGEPVTSHTTNPVPLILAGAGNVELAADGKLCDLAPTLLTLLGVSIPEEMTGKSLIKVQ